MNKTFFDKACRSAVVGVALWVAGSAAQAETLFPEPAYVSLKESAQVVKYPGSVVWAGGPKML